ncbi:hypothetical protein KGF57_004438 [Candida theae]|uniref:F-box domain-containing protein n=1 Tax=Candida theae TaxID=1198502 RepID=A0AAD5FWV1_9ASCO|nr:uncharacterized protein KGF57_004438 [Candida theae]KAI5950092.1 hypothetical protein KGF57_004438 [Candida theae]
MKGIKHSGRRGQSLPKRALALSTLPNDVIHIIFTHLTIQDLQNLSVLNREYRELLVPHLLSRVKAQWYKLIDESEGTTSVLKKYKYVIHQLRIIDSFPYGDWQIDIFQDVLYQLPKLQHLLINTVSSSGWLRYRANQTITKLTLYSEANVNDTQSRLQPHNKDNVTRKLNTYHPLQMFNVEHLENFKMLQHLELEGYHISWDPGSIRIPVLTLTSLTLVDCQWNYPFELKHFNYNNTLEHLSLQFKNGSTFEHSERFRDFILNLGESGGLESIASLELIHNDVKAETHHLNVDETFLKRILSGKGLPNLRRLVLRGWRVNCAFYWHRLVEILQSKQELTALDFDVVSSFGSGINTGVVKEWCREMCPWMKVCLNVRELQKA